MRYLQIAFALLIFLSQNNLYSQTSYSKELKSEAKLRSEPRVDVNIVAYIPKGTDVTIVDEDGSYYKVYYKGNVGYLSKIYFNAVLPPSDDAVKTYSKKPSKQWTETTLKNHWGKNGAGLLEGIYIREVRSTIYYYGSIQKTVRVVREEKYYIMKLKGDNNYVLASFDNKFISKVTFNDYSNRLFLNTNAYNPSNMGDDLKNISAIRISKTDFQIDNFTIEAPDDHNQYIQINDVFSKIYSPEIATVGTSGTGFAISSNGYITTNYHVVKGASKIKVRGVKGNFSKTYDAEIIIEDKNNDIAIIKINDPDFTTLGTIPYTLNSNLIDVGSSVYSLGYPLRASMGDEVKLTNGIISSKTGFQGDITTYQTTVPVQPGNSGGPLFNNKGEIVGIINAKHSDAENASYAIKTNYLMSLIQTMDVSLDLPIDNKISVKGLSEQVKFVKEYIYILEID